MTLYGRLRAYMAHDDPATATANTVAVMVGWNGPFYPLYVIWLAGRGISAFVWLTALSTPFFLAIPAISRRSSRAGRIALPVIGTINTVWCIKLLGPDCGLALFLLPCLGLSALLFRQSERLLMLGACVLAFAAYVVPARYYGTPLVAISPDAANAISGLNEASVMGLAFFIAWKTAQLLRVSR